MKRLAGLFTLALLGLFLCGSARAQVTHKVGAAFRLRHEFWRNWSDADSGRLDNRNFFRIRSSLWGRLDAGEKVGLYARLTNEFKPYVYYAPSSSKPSGKDEKGLRFDIDEFVFDNLYLDVKKVFGQPVDIRAGRQDFLGTYGEGFLIMEGTPQDGSRTFYFNALKAAWSPNGTNGFDFIYINNPRDDQYLPAINEDKSPQPLNVTDEEAYVLYWKNSAKKELPFEAYYIYKREDDEGGRGAQAEKGIINTIGACGKYIFSPWTLRGQLAGQFGNYGLDDRQGLGGYAYVDRDFEKVRWAPKASFGYIYLSGDDKNTGDNEGWDPLFSRYPWISDLYTLSMATETGMSGYWTNLMVWRLEFSVKPTQKTKLSVWYNYLRANEETVATGILSGDGLNRGHLPQVKFEVAFTKDITSYILAECLIPGDYYADDDPMLFTRVELHVKF